MVLSILSVQELIDMVIMTLFVGFIFKDNFALGANNPKYSDPLEYYTKRTRKTDFFDGFWFAIIATVPAILFHELSHKFVALSFNMTAVFHAAYTWLGVGLVLKLLNFGFIFFVPAFISVSGIGSPLQYAAVAFAGPFMNLLLYLITVLLSKQKIVNKKYLPILVLSKKINLFLFIFNMLPIPGFDGYSVFYNLFKVFF